MIYLRQSTASQEVPLGYFVDSTDGDTAKTALSIANTDINIWKTGATTLASKTLGGATHISGGIYYAVLDATDTDTIGPLVIFVHVATALTVRLECCVLDEAVYDALFGTVALATATNITGGTITNLTNLPSIPAGWLTAAGIAASALNGKGDWMVSYTQPTGFLAATFPLTVASTTNITGGTITTVTNLTNAPTAGDLTAAMKTSVQVASQAALDANIAELAAVPAVNASVASMLKWLFTLSRNLVTQTATEQKVYKDDAATLVATSTVSDLAGTFTRGEFI